MALTLMYYSKKILGYFYLQLWKEKGVSETELISALWWYVIIIDENKKTNP